MIDNIEYYMEYLDGLTKDMPEEFVKLAQVFEPVSYTHLTLPTN